jgi:hypothetical protein
MVHIANAPQGWANPTDCGPFTCTAPYNIVMRLESPRYGGDSLPFGIPSRTYEIISNNVESISAQVIPDCEYQEEWNAWMCLTDKIGQLIFDSKDADRMDRSSQPIYIQNNDLCAEFEGEEVCFNNRLNAYMDHGWDGFYTSQKREQRFPTLVDLRADGYNIEYTGTPPNEQEFRLIGVKGAPGILVTILYPNAGAYQVYDRNRRPV